MAGVLRHELGHTYDRVAKPNVLDISESDGFLKAYKKDVAAVQDQWKEELEYFLQDGAAGPSEAFAEGFGVLQGGGSMNSRSRAGVFKHSFTNTLAEIERLIKGGEQR